MIAAPFENVPVLHPNGKRLPVTCEVRVYSSDRSDFGGHQCGNLARWIIDDFDEWGDIVLCGLHKAGDRRRSTEIHSVFGLVAGEPTSVRFWRQKRSAATVR